MVNSKYSVSSKKWMRRHFRDQYVYLAKKMKVRSRAWFKLDQINNIDFLFRSGMYVLDLGSAPGGWSEYAKNKVGKHGRVIACDCLPMDRIVGVDFFHGDFCTSDVLKVLIGSIKKHKVDVVLSDMSPNFSGIIDVDIYKSIYLGGLVLDACKYLLTVGGSFVVKIFQGNGFDEYYSNVYSSFNMVKIRKPLASRIHSREVYIVAKGYNL